MSNIHGITDLGDNSRRQSFFPLSNQNTNAMNSIITLPFSQYKNTNEDPRSLSFIGTIQSILCPGLRPLSFIFIISMIDIVFYLFTVIYSLFNGGLSTKTTTFLGPSIYTLNKFGAKVNIY